MNQNKPKSKTKRKRKMEIEVLFTVIILADGNFSLMLRWLSNGKGSEAPKSRIDIEHLENIGIAGLLQKVANQGH